MTPSPAIHSTATRLPAIVSTLPQLRAAVAAARQEGRTIGLVPTMGALHAGHVSLVEASLQAGHFTVVTIFVNPTQFAPHEDFAKYPRTLAEDQAALGQAGADLIYAPAAEEVYPPGHSTTVNPPAVAERWEGERRPGHFRGVATVVLKLLLSAQPDVAYFGQKDYQQTCVIRQLVADLDVPTAIEVRPTIREPDGLAMSSRNRYLSGPQRQQALALSRALAQAGRRHERGERDASRLMQGMRDELSAAGVTQVDYAVVVDAQTLEPLQQIERPAVALVAATVGATRLIDNLLLGK